MRGIMKNPRFTFILLLFLLTMFTALFLTGVAANAQTYTVLYKFQGGNDGGVPYEGLVRDSAGNLYGTTSGVGAHSYGTIFRLDPAGNETVLYRFTDGTDGKFPNAGLVLDSAGNLYGTTQMGGMATGGVGIIFKLDSSGQLTVLHTFGSVDWDGAYPTSRMIQDSEGNLYGSTPFGGVTGRGVIFKLDLAGNYSILYSFTSGFDGGSPTGPLVRDTAGNLFGVTNDWYVCCNYSGRVFELDTSGNLTVLYLFTGGADGATPVGGLIRDTAGNLYGATQYGGDFTCDSNYGCGVVFKLDSSGIETVLHAFTGPPDGLTPNTGLLADGKGNIFGATLQPGVYKINIATGSEVVLPAFGKAQNGWQPNGTLIGDRDGNMYGTTAIGGQKSSLCKNGCGVVYKVSHN
jgi:uncharacterized repeat protein (TIGR03803 family)